MLDAVHHLNVGKCGGNQRLRRQVNPATIQQIEQSFNDFLDQYNEKETNSDNYSVIKMASVFDSTDVVTLKNNVTYLKEEVSDEVYPDANEFMSADDPGGFNTTGSRFNPERDFAFLENKCKTKTRYVMRSGLFFKCNKKVKWRQRSEHLLSDLTRMKTTCLKHRGYQGLITEAYNVYTTTPYS